MRNVVSHSENDIEKNLLIAFLGFLSMDAMSQTTYIRQHSIPWEAHKKLNNEFGDWEYFGSPIFSSDTSGVGADWEYADIIKGDFNDDSEEDFALLVKPYEINAGYLVVVFRKGSHYKLKTIEKISYRKDYVLFLAPKGSEDYDHSKGENFTMPIDGIMLNVYEKGGEAYYLKDGEFIKVLSSD